MAVLIYSTHIAVVPQLRDRLVQIVRARFGGKASLKGGCRNRHRDRSRNITHARNGGKNAALIKIQIRLRDVRG